MIDKYKAVFGLYVVLLPFVAMASPGSDNGNATAAMNREIASYIEAFKKQDAAAMSDLYASDVVIIEHDELPRKGRGAIQKMWEDNRKNHNQWVDCQIDRENTRVEGDVAYEYGRSDFKFRTPAGVEKHLKGQFMTIWRRQLNGAWKVQMESWL